MFDRITYEEFLDWVAYWNRSPWGEERADARNAVAISYQLAAWSDGEVDLPSVTWPYFDSAESIDFAAAEAAIEAHRKAYNLP